MSAGPPRIFVSATAFAAAYPDVAFPSEHDPAPTRYDASGLGVIDDVFTAGRLLSIELLPAGGGTDLVAPGVVVATVWGDAPVYVLAEGVILSQVWRSLTDHLPTRLSAVHALIP